MALPITYFHPPNLQELMQGDILIRTPELVRVLAEVHPYFEQSKYLCFMVVTQSCDLVVRQSGVCKAPYISIAPIRSLDTVIERELAEHRLAIEAELPVITDRSRAKVEMFLSRLFNNNEPGFFYLDSQETELSEDCCAYLNLSVALKSPLHFGTMLAAKRLQLKPEWQAKLGWLVAQLFGRVGTEDLELSKLTAKVKNALGGSVAVVPDGGVKALLAAEVARRAVVPSPPKLRTAEVMALVKKAANKKQDVINQTMAVLDTALQPVGVTPAQLVTVRKRLENDTGLAHLLKA